MIDLITSLNFSSKEFVNNPKEQARILQFFDDLKKSPAGWKSCMNAVYVENVDDQLKFFCLQIVENYIKTDYSQANTQDLITLRQFLQHWLTQITLKTKIADSYFLKNKFAQLFSIVFLADFPNKWSTFMQDMFLNNSFDIENEASVEFYLLVLLQIDVEISDREVPKSKEIADRNTIIRDNMRIFCVPDLIESWFKILIRYKDSNAKVTSSCLHCLGGYIEWIDIGLVANDRFMPLIVECLIKKFPSNCDSLSIASSDCLCSILNKGMEAQLKLQLIEAVDKILNGAGVFKFDENDSEAVSRIAEIISCVGSLLIELYHKTSKSSQLNQLTPTLLALIESKLSVTLLCLAHDDISIATYAAQFCHEYVVLLKQLNPLDWKRREFLGALLSVLLKRYKYPSEYDHEREGEDELDFQEFRKELKTIFTNIALLDLPLAIDHSEKLVVLTFSGWNHAHYTDVELAISLLHILGEVISFNQGSAMVSSDETNVRLRRLVHLMVSSGASKQKHLAVCLQYFETVCRFDKTIAMEPALLPDVIASFLDDRGLHHSVAKVRSRATYLFSKFIRLQKSSVQNQVTQILFYLQDLLELSPTSSTRLITSEDQLFLFEAVGVLIISGSHNNQEKRNFMQQLLGSLVTRFNQAMNVLQRTSNEQERKILIDFINYLMAYASRTSKAFSPQLTMKACNCEDIFVELMKVFLDALNPQLTSSEPLLNGLRQYLHRMIISLSDEIILPCMPQILQKFIAIIKEPRLLQDFLTLVQQAIIKYKANFVAICRSDMIFVYQAVWRHLATPVDPDDEVASRDGSYLRRAYYQLLSQMAKNGLFDLWLCLNQSDLEILLQSIVQGALMIKEPTIQKSCFNTVQRCLEAAQNKNAPEFALNFAEYFFRNALPACFVAPLKNGVDFQDAQSVMVINEIGCLLKQFYTNKGDVFLQSLGENLWPQLNLPTENLNEFCFALKSIEMKAYPKYLRTFFENMAKTMKFD